jgi:RNA polymerase sigma-70 factor (sigma-E family)
MAPGGGVGQDAEFQEFFAGQYEALCRLGYWLTGDRAEGEELAQEALVRVYWRWAIVRRLDRPPDYARKVLVNRYRSLLRRALVEARHAGRARAAAPEPVDHDGSLVLRAAVRRLPPRQRAVVVLRYQEDLPEVEVARLLGCSVGTVKSTASRALARLRTEFGGESGGLARHTEQGERR